MQVILSLLAIALLIGLILFHEYGHFLLARRNGVVVEEFGLGLPPRAYGRRLKSGLLLSINWLPLGGFVNLKGQHDGDKEKGSFGAAKLGAKSRILLAGVAANALAGFLILTILALVGMPVLITKDNIGQNQFSIKSDTKIIRQNVAFGSILPGSPADKAGFRSTDLLTSISNGQSTKYISEVPQLHSATKEFAGQAVDISYQRSGQQEHKTVQLLTTSEVQASLKTDNPKGYLGIVPSPLVVQRSTWSAPLTAAGFTGQISWLTLKGIGHAFGGLGSAIAGGLSGNHQARVNGQTEASSQVGGPVAIAKLLWGSGSLGINFVLMFIAIISITLALINLLPIPALDGGRLAIILIARALFGRPFSTSTEEKIVNSSMAVVLLLTLLITIVDVNRFF